MRVPSSSQKETDFTPNHSCLHSPALCLIMYKLLLPEPTDKEAAVPALPSTNSPPERPRFTLCSKVCAVATRSPQRAVGQGAVGQQQLLLYYAKIQVPAGICLYKSSRTHRVGTVFFGLSPSAHTFQARKNFFGKVTQQQDYLIGATVHIGITCGKEEQLPGKSILV